jgi:hypothetical protein
MYTTPMILRSAVYLNRAALGICQLPAALNGLPGGLITHGILDRRGKRALHGPDGGPVALHPTRQWSPLFRPVHLRAKLGNAALPIVRPAAPMASPAQARLSVPTRTEKPRGAREMKSASAAASPPLSLMPTIRSSSPSSSSISGVIRLPRRTGYCKR